MATSPSLRFLKEDYPRTLFPLSSTVVVLENHESAVRRYLYDQVLNPSVKEHSFVSQTRVFASKTGLNLRRTVKLDPVAEYFVYDVVYGNRSLFVKNGGVNRRSFGYRFKKGQPISASSSYGRFRKAIIAAQKKYKYSLKFDIAAYFNSLYHHDLVNWAAHSSWAEADVANLGQFLREANTGRTVDCLPHGLYPCKMIGADFLKFVDNSARVRCALVLRFMDDFYLFDRSEEVLNDDFLLIQRLLGEKALSLNGDKTTFGVGQVPDIKKQVDDIKLSLLRIRRRIIEVSDQEVEELEEEYEPLQEEQVQYLLDLLKDPDIDEADVELVLVLLKEHGEDVLAHVYGFLERFPSLSRKVYRFSRDVSDKTELSALLLRFVRKGKNVTEDQLFWIAKIAEEQLGATAAYPELLLELYNHPRSTTVTKAKILETPEKRFSMGDLREDHLKAGKSDWLAWSSAVGTRNEKPITRNHLLGYFGKASPINRLVADCVRALK